MRMATVAACRRIGGSRLSDSSLAQPRVWPKAKLTKATKAFRTKDDDADRELLLAAFAAQSSIDWPDLDALLGEDA